MHCAENFVPLSLVMVLTKKQIILISSSLTLFLIAGVWFFFFKTPDTDVVWDPVMEKPEKQESADDIRIRHMKLIKKSLDTALAQGRKIPLPANAVEIHFGSTPLVYQGETSEFFYDTIGLNPLLDPVTQKPYSFALSHDGTKYQFFASLDDVQRGNYSTSTMVYSVWEGSLFVQNNEKNVITLERAQKPNIDLSVSEVRKRVGLETLKSCREILVLKNWLDRVKSWVYTIDIKGKEASVYCDMQTDGGGWTLFYANNGYEDSPIAKSFVEMRETMKTTPTLDLSKYDDKYLTGLLDYSHFTENGSTEILIRNRASPDQKKWVKFIFSTTRTLDWALGPLVLGKTDYACVNLPRRGTWIITNNDQTIVYQDLRQIMNHGGTSWGVSHEKYPCNNLEVSANAHIAFYNASLSLFSDRNRSNEGIGGWWWAGGEYRYFVR